jgi:hypothetical protein
MEKTVDTFFDEGRRWDRAFESDYADKKDWKEQLRLIVLHIDYLLFHGWELPDGVDLNYMREQAFSD